MSRLRRSFGASLFAAAALAGLAACGGGSGSDEAKTTATSTESTVRASRGGDFCGKIAATYNEALGFAGSDATSPDELRKQLQTTLTNGQDTIDEAPAEVKADLQVIQDGVKQFDEALAKVGYDAAKLGPDAVAAISVFSTPQFQQAANNSQTYVQQNCGIDLQPTTTDT